MTTMTPIQDAIDPALHDAPAEQQAYHPDVLAALDPALTQAVAEATTQLQRATEQLQAAQERLTTQQRAQPADASSVSKWAAQLGKLRDELAAYEAIAERAQQTLSAAQEALGTAYEAQWRVAYDAALAAFNATCAAASEQYRAWKSAGLRLQWENYLDVYRAADAYNALMWKRPPSVAEHALDFEKSNVLMYRNGFLPPQGTEYSSEADAARVSRGVPPWRTIEEVSE